MKPRASARPCTLIGSSQHPSAAISKSGSGSTRDLGGLMTTAATTKLQDAAVAPAGLPDMKVSVRQVFGIDSDLEVSGRLTLLDQNKVIKTHRAFRLFSTANTVGVGDTSGLSHGTQQINQGQMDCWSIITTLN